MRSIRSHFEFLLEFADGMLESGVGFDHIINRLNGMYHCTMIPSAKMVTNRLERMIREFF